MLALAAVLSLVIGASLGLLGGGGSILTVPVLAYVVGLPAKEAIATSLVVVGVTSAVALIPHARRGHVDWRMGGLFGLAGMAGAWMGGFAAGWMSGRVLMVLFALMMVVTAVFMVRGRRTEGDDAPHAPHATWRILLDGLVVGGVTGLVGAGGGFLVVPALVLLGGVPMRTAVGTSLLVIAMKSGAGFLGHAMHVPVDPVLAGVVASGAVVGSLLGSLASSRVPQAALRQGFAGFVLVMGIVQLAAELA